MVDKLRPSLQYQYLPSNRTQAVTSSMGCRWTALCLAVESEWGGRESRQKAEQMYQDILSWFYDNKGAHGNSYLQSQIPLTL